MTSSAANPDESAARRGIRGLIALELMSLPTSALSRGQLVAWRNAIFVIFAMPGLAFASWASRLPAVRDALELNPAQVGILLFGMAVGSIVGLAASSHVVARIGATATMVWGILGCAVGLAVVGLGGTLPSFPIAIIGLAMFGCCTGATDVAMNVSGAAVERALGRSIMPIFHAFFSIGTMVGAGLGALAEWLAFPVAVHLGIVAVVLAVGLAFARPALQSEQLVHDDGQPAAQDEPADTWRARLAIWRDPRTLLIGLLVLSAAFAEGSANDWLAIAMVDGHGVSNATGALVFGIFVTAMTVGRLAGIVLLDRFGRIPVLRGSFLLASAGLLIVIFVPNSGIATVGAVLWGLGSALGFPVGMSAAADDPKTAAARVSVVATIGYFAFLVGPPLIGLLGDRFSVLSALLVVLVLAAVGAAVAGAAREPRAHETLAPGPSTAP